MPLLTEGPMSEERVNWGSRWQRLPPQPFQTKPELQELVSRIQDSAVEAKVIGMPALTPLDRSLQLAASL